MNPPNSNHPSLAPPRATPGHRRAHSDTSFRFSDDLDDDFLFDIDNFNISSLDLPPSPPPVPSKSEESTGGGGGSNGGGGGGGADTGASSRTPPPSHLRSLSVDADFFDGLSFSGDAEGGGVRKHRRTNSMDGGGSSSSMMELESCVDGVKKAMPPERLAELALIDPKRAKRILANRQSAARSKERKIKYTSELERKVQTLQTEATTLSAQVTLLQRDTSGLSVENKELKLRLKSLEQQAQLRDALNEALRQEVQRLRLATGQVPSGNISPSLRGLLPQFSAQFQNLHPFGGQQNQQQSQPQLQPRPQQNQQQSQPQLQPRPQQSTQLQNIPPFGDLQNQPRPRQQQPTQLQNLPSFGGQQNQQQSQQQPRLQQLLQQQFQMPNQPSSSHQQLKPSFMDFNHRV